jgi:hypothetical protein
MALGLKSRLLLPPPLHLSFVTQVSISEPVQSYIPAFPAERCESATYVNREHVPPAIKPHLEVPMSMDQTTPDTGAVLPLPV